jgi:pimeloyl-ACP methyl ester carboxylesterase
MRCFSLDGQRLAYTVRGEGPRLTVLLHGLLFSQRMHEALAAALAERGHRVVTLDLLGHGESDRPRDKWRYSMPAFGGQVVALLDHLGEPEAVVLGTSLGANVALEVAAQAPERLRGMVVEMPVLDHALLGCAIAFTPIMVALTAGEPAMRALARLARAVPRRRLPWQADILLDWIRQDPEPSAAVFQGLFFGRTAPPREERREMEMPALVIGHQYDIIHPFSDAGMLVEELPNGRLLEASSLIELRVAPRRLTDEIARFIDECWRPRAARQRARAS